MKKVSVFCAMCTLVFLTMFCIGGPQEKELAELKQGSFYTTTNIWFEDTEGILSTNYHVGTIIPAGTEVKIVSRSWKKIIFSDTSGLVFTLNHVEKQSRITLVELFDRYFSKENVMAEGGKFSHFTEIEKRNIKDGRIDIAMSKDAVLMAYGYPPSHKTPSLNYNTWTYWKMRMAREIVYFNEDGRVKNIEK